MRPVLLPSVRRLWRDRETLQLGRLPGRAVVLAGLDDGTRTVLTLLDGTRDDDQLRREAAARGCPPERTAALLALLDDAGALGDAAAGPPAAGLDPGERERTAADTAALGLQCGRAAPETLARRRAARVRVVGAGRVGATIAGLLAGAGVGAVDVEDAGLTRPQDTSPGGPGLADVGRTRGQAVRERLAEWAPSVDLGVGAAHLVVLAPADGSVDEHRDVVAGRAAHLLAEVRDTVGVVGPLVLPGGSACLQCLELARCDRDPDWPVLSAQLSQRSRGSVSCDGVLAVAVAAQAAAQALAALDGAVVAALGATLELALPDWRWRRRSWAQHPDCRCGRAAG